MIINTSKGIYFVEKNYRDAYNLEAFESKYIEECMDRHLYIVGDISSGILRLKGFDDDPKSASYYGLIDEYLKTSCAMGCAYYVLRRMHSEEECEKYKDLETDTTGSIVITPMKKESFDKDALVLQSNPKSKVNININLNKINEMPKIIISKEMEEIIKEDKESLSNNRQAKKAIAEEKIVEQTTYVSSSPDFDPSKKQKNFGNRNNKNFKNNNNNKNHNNNKNYNDKK